MSRQDSTVSSSPFSPIGDHPSGTGGISPALGFAALDMAPQALVVARTDGVALFMNARARAVLGVSAGAQASDWAGRLPSVGGVRDGGWINLPRGDGTDVPCWVWSRALPAADATSSAAVGSAGSEPGSQATGHAVLHALWPCRVESLSPTAGEHPGLDDLVVTCAHHALLGEMGGALVHQMSQPLNVIRLTAERAVLEAEQMAGAEAPRDPVVERFARLADQAESLFDLVALVQGAPVITGVGDLTPVDLGAVMTRAAMLARGPLRAAGLKTDLEVPETMPLAWGEPSILLQVGYAVLTVLADSVQCEEGDHRADPGHRLVPGRHSASADPARALVVRVDPEEAAPGRLVVDLARDLAFEGRVPLIAMTPDLSISRRAVLAAMALAPLGGHLLMLVDEQGALRGARLDLARVMSGWERASAEGRSRAVSDVGEGRIRLLLAEDEIEAATEIAEYLQDLEYEVVTVEDAVAGVRALDESTFDVVISDVSMPGGGARALLRAVEAGHPNVAVILVSGLAMDHDPERAELADMADAVLRKPLGLGQLRETVERVLAGDTEAPV